MEAGKTGGQPLYLVAFFSVKTYSQQVFGGKHKKTNKNQKNL